MRHAGLSDQRTKSMQIYLKSEFALIEYSISDVSQPAGVIGRAVLATDVTRSRRLASDICESETSAS